MKSCIPNDMLPAEALAKLKEGQERRRSSLVQILESLRMVEEDEGEDEEQVEE